MHLPLLCLTAHACIPAFLPGNAASLSDDRFTMGRTPRLLRRLGTALRDGAMIVPPNHGPTFEEIELEVEAETAAIQARIDAILASLHPPQALAS